MCAAVASVGGEGISGLEGGRRRRARGGGRLAASGAGKREDGEVRGRARRRGRWTRGEGRARTRGKWARGEGGAGRMGEDQAARVGEEGGVGGERLLESEERRGREVGAGRVFVR